MEPSSTSPTIGVHRLVCVVHGMDPTPEQDARFGEPNAPPTSWADALHVLKTAELFWISTVRSDGRPHVTPLPAVWFEEQLHFCTGPDEQKAVNIAGNPRGRAHHGLQPLEGGPRPGGRGRRSPHQ